MRLLGALTGISAAAVTTVLASAAPAHALSVSVYEGRDYTEVSSTRHTAYTCNQDKKSNGVYGKVIAADSRGYRTFYMNDDNGTAAGCGWVSTDRPIVYIEVCRDDWGGDACRGTWL
ncbi:hypothetical protein GWI34_20915 [Actinomadura sp. DSM 109109]|nr:hypothetical protein [Actinomadura lepetitiana]